MGTVDWPQWTYGSHDEDAPLSCDLREQSHGGRRLGGATWGGHFATPQERHLRALQRMIGYEMNYAEPSKTDT
jgi:hypothetical protein